MLHALFMTFTEQALDAVLVFEVEVAQPEVSFDYLIKNVKVERQSIGGLDTLNQLSADGTSDAHLSRLLVHHGEALSAERVTAVNEDTRYLVANVEVLATKVAEVEASRLVITLNLHCFLSRLFQDI